MTTTKSLKLKLRTGSVSETIRKGLWETHRLHNAAVKYYMEWLLLIRQKPFLGYSQTEVNLELQRRLMKQQEQNGTKAGAVDDELLECLRNLYELIVPSAAGQKGDAQQIARSFLSPLTDPDSHGLEGVSKAGAKPKWKRMQEAGDPNWEQEKQKAEERKKENPARKIMQKLRECGVKPLFPLYTDSVTNVQWLPKKKKEFVRNWDRDAFQQAIERLLTWETWSLKVWVERQKLQEQAEKLESTHFSAPEDAAWLKAMRNYELEREQQLQREAHPESRYRIMGRELRGWEAIYPQWMELHRSGERSEQAYRDIWTTYQTRNRKEFGDPWLYGMLSRPENHHLWVNRRERFKHLVKYNYTLFRLESAKEEAQLTLPDPVDHPLWVRFDPKGGNLYSYLLESEDEKHKHLIVTFQRLLVAHPEGNGYIEAENVQIPIATSKQFYRQVRLKNQEKDYRKVKLRDYSAGNIDFEGQLGGAKLQFERLHLEKRRRTVQAGDIGKCYLNVAIHVEAIQSVQKSGQLNTPLGKVFQYDRRGEFPSVQRLKPDALSQYLAAHTSEKKAEAQDNVEPPFKVGKESLAEGLRVLSIDLGQRSAATYSVFEAVTQKPESGKLHFPIHGTSAYAVHRRSGRLLLEGEEVGSSERQARKEHLDQLYKVRYQVRLLSGILRLHKYDEPVRRIEAINKLLNEIEMSERLDDGSRQLWLSVFCRINEHVTSEAWEDVLIAEHRGMEAHVGRTVSEWRRSVKKKMGSSIHTGFRGLSMWSLDELEQTRKLLISWSRRTRKPGEVSHLQQNEAFAAKLLNHIQQVKKDRLAKTANAIVMTALGYVYDQKRREWVAKYPACQLILFENLSRYLFRNDRSREENSKLMKWAHRSIPKITYHQAQPFGIMIGFCDSEFTSQLYARNGAPGIRCRVVTKEHVNENGKNAKDRRPKRVVYYEDDRFREIADDLQEQDYVPDEGGEMFVTIRENGSLLSVHADINAAQNLQRRFWMDYRMPSRLSCVRVKEGFVPKSKRWQTIMGSGFLEKTASDVYIWTNSSKLKVKSINGDEEEVAFDWEDSEELGDQQFRTFFCDRSGIFFSSEQWVPANVFWRDVRERIISQFIERVMKRKQTMAPT